MARLEVSRTTSPRRLRSSSDLERLRTSLEAHPSVSTMISGSSALAPSRERDVRAAADAVTEATQPITIIRSGQFGATSSPTRAADRDVPRADADGGAHRAAAPTSSGARGLPYMPGLDGVRAIAVIGVLVYHLGIDKMPGGFLGVDVFFVLSGFLITSLLLSEADATGRISFRQFYLRRARRLLPALFTLLAVTALYSASFARDAASRLIGDIAAALTYISNWWYIAQDTSYFEAIGRPPEASRRP